MKPRRFTIILDHAGKKVTAEAGDLRGALNFIAAFCGYEFGVFDSGWQHRDGRWYTQVHDWIDGWFTAPPPIVAYVIAPQGFVPTA